MTVDGAVAHRRTAGLIERCYAGLDATELRTETLRRLRTVLPVDAAFFATVDPATVLFTSALAEEPLRAATPLFLANEYDRADVNKFTALAGAADPVGSLDHATRGERRASPRYQEIMAGLGLGDELRAALTTGPDCWGVLCLHRADSALGFTEEEIALVRALAPHLGEGLRRAVATGPAAPADPAGEPGIIVLDDRLAVLSVSPEAARWAAELAEPAEGGLPVAVRAVAARLRRLAHPDAAGLPPPTLRLRAASGRWLTVHATHLPGPDGHRMGVVIGPAPAAQVSSLLLTAHGLTEAQTRVAALVARGSSTRQIVDELHISANTVQEHLTAIFDKFAVHSCRELVAALLAPRP
ncbi:LuxR family transcriptional regulator [Kitasatospora sp. MMS16-BH015]|uniref:helix-turn-helix transcriptional regulator n=1 Tax=Kitasatospora sp. MMS16-BH015 TaxID=2018025 RepID=UPI000CA1EDBC|nr:LuxR C-terminal-related transcriptional regulator [Kitasatospora sp. MMS16-BH015]AUG76720.1 LuxR family transcriptional regulator [Kitasatospora sp. MMS16-BH015]